MELSEALAINDDGELKRILVVDDNSDICDLVKTCLEELGPYQVQTETDGRLAMAAVQAFEPNLILLDIVMPRIDGPEISRRLTWEERYREIPVVFITGIVTDEEINALHGAVDGRPCMAKPLTIEKLLGCVRRHLAPPAAEIPVHPLPAFTAAQNASI